MSPFKRLLRVFVSLGILTPLAFSQADDCNDATPITGTGAWAFDTSTASFTGSPSSCTQAGASAPNVWFLWTPPSPGDYDLFICGASYDVVITVYGSACGTPEAICNDGFATEYGSCTGTISDVGVTLAAQVPGVSRLIQISGWNQNALGTGLLQVEVAQGSGPPANDECEGAQVLQGTGPFFFNTLLATDSGIDSPCSSVTGAPDVWFQWTAPTSGDYELSLCASQGGVTSLTAYDFCGGTPLACYEDILSGTCGNPGSTYLYNVPAGTPILLQVDAAIFDGRLRIIPFESIPGDLCSEALPAPQGEGQVPFSTLGATPGPLGSCAATSDGDIWLTWTPTSAQYELRVRNHGWDARLSLWDACGGMELACGAGREDLRLPVDVTPGTPYLIQIDGLGYQGEGTLELRERIGRSYCLASPNSASPAGARIHAVGQESLAAQDLRLTAVGLPPAQSGIFYYGADEAQASFGNGVRCIMGETMRLPVAFATNYGILGTEVSFAEHGAQFAVLGTVRFQAWYRDPTGGAAGFNLSDALVLVFAP